MKNSTIRPVRFFLPALAVLTAARLEVDAGTLTLVAGSGASTADNVKATEATLNTPFGVEFDKAGALYFVEMNGHRLCKVDTKGVVTTWAGTGKKGDSGDGGPARQAQFNGMHNLAIAPNDDIIVADTWNNRVRKIDARTQLVTTLAGTGERGFGGDGGPATQAKFGNVYCVSLDPQAAHLYLADLDNRRIRAIDLNTGIVKTVAGNGQTGVPKDGAVAIEAPLVDPRAVAANATGDVYILERSGNALRVVGRDGKVRTVAGTGAKGAGGDGGDAIKATLNGPKHLCVDRDGNVLIADSENHLIRKYLPATGKIVRVAGTGNKGANGLNGPPEQAELSQPHGVTFHRDGTLYIADSSNGRIVKIAK